MFQEPHKGRRKVKRKRMGLAGILTLLAAVIGCDGGAGFSTSWASTTRRSSR
jgi:hypothetical protein